VFLFLLGSGCVCVFIYGASVFVGIYWEMAVFVYRGIHLVVPVFLYIHYGVAVFVYSLREFLFLLGNAHVSLFK
jgi:hypothetical protein